MTREEGEEEEEENVVQHWLHRWRSWQSLSALGVCGSIANSFLLFIFYSEMKGRFCNAHFWPLKAHKCKFSITFSDRDDELCKRDDLPGHRLPPALHLHHPLAHHQYDGKPAYLQRLAGPGPGRVFCLLLVVVDDGLDVIRKQKLCKIFYLACLTRTVLP